MSTLQSRPRCLSSPSLTSRLPPFFFLLLRPPPRSTLFPYTTLFRSSCRRHRRESHDRGRSTPPADRSWATGRSCPGTARSRDRKSTRLNSSHVAISYAVFCLKKKKKKKQDDKLLIRHKNSTSNIIVH